MPALRVHIPQVLKHDAARARDAEAGQFAVLADRERDVGAAAENHLRTERRVEDKVVDTIASQEAMLESVHGEVAAGSEKGLERLRAKSTAFLASEQSDFEKMLNLDRASAKADLAKTERGMSAMKDD